jgi:hypothetical protein
MHPARLCLRKFATICAFVLGASLSSGCAPRSGGETERADAPEASLAEQAQGVREGRSTQIRLDRTTVRDEDLGLLDGLDKRLTRVNFSRTEITDDGLARLCRLEMLEQLRISGPRITDDGLAAIAGLTHLRFLHLLDVPMTDSGLDRLHALTTLESLYLDRTKVTDEGLARLLAALPDVHLHIDDHHHPADSHAADHAH